MMNRRECISFVLKPLPVGAYGSRIVAVCGNSRMFSNAKAEETTIMPIPEKFTWDTLSLFRARARWGSIASLNVTGPGFRADQEAGAKPLRETSVWEVPLDPYFGGAWVAAGALPEAARVYGGAEPA